MSVQHHLCAHSGGYRFAGELEKRNHVTGEVLKNTPLFRRALNTAASNEIGCLCEHCVRRAVTKFYESGAAFVQFTGAPVSEMRCCRAYYQVFPKTTKGPHGRPYAACLSGKSWDEALCEREVEIQLHGVGLSAVEPHSTVYCTHALLKHTDVTVLVDNECLYDIPQPEFFTSNAQHNFDVNWLLAQTIYMGKAACGEEKTIAWEETLS